MVRVTDEIFDHLLLWVRQLLKSVVICLIFKLTTLLFSTIWTFDDFLRRSASEGSICQQEVRTTFPLSTCGMNLDEECDNAIPHHFLNWQLRPHGKPFFIKAFCCLILSMPRKIRQVIRIDSWCICLLYSPLFCYNFFVYL